MRYLGYRYSGWQRQPGQKTLEGMIRKTLKFVRPDCNFRVQGASRTDAKVSALRMAFQLISSKDLSSEITEFTLGMNTNLPQDIRILAMEEAPAGLDIIGDVRLKEYGYFFTFGKDHHPFSAPFSAHFEGDLDLSLMMETAPVFEGEHSFHNFTARLQPGKKVLRNIEHCRIGKNEVLKDGFLTGSSYLLSVKAEGFMRYQIRLMMGALVMVGRGQIPPTCLKEALVEGKKYTFPFIAPASGLILMNMHFR